MGTIPCLPLRTREDIRYKSQMIELKGQRDELESYKNILCERIASLMALSIQHAKENNRERALFTLRKKTLIQKQLVIVDEFLFKILTVISDTETARVQLDVLKHIEIGAKLIREISNEIRAKDYDSLMEIESECMNNIADAMGMYTEKYCKVDDYELLKELDTLISSENAKKMDVSVEVTTSLSDQMAKEPQNVESKDKKNIAFENLKEPVLA